MSEFDQLFFDSIKEDRGWYFVEYNPPEARNPFATLQVVVLDAAKASEDIASTMEAELVIWLERYPVPIMVSAFDSSGNFLSLETCRPWSHLSGYIDTRSNNLVRKWSLIKDEAWPKAVLDAAYLREIYADIPHRTKEQQRQSSRERAKRMRVGWWLVFVWAVVVPASVAIIEWWSDWLGFAVLFYSLFKAAQKALELTGKWPKSKAVVQEEMEAARIRHHHYHCEQNPEGFERLKRENFERWEREEIRDEVQSLRRSVKDKK